MNELITLSELIARKALDDYVKEYYWTRENNIISLL